MEPLAILHADRLDLLFENRNKLYGAYPLRKYYHRRLYTAMATVFGIVLIFSCLILFMRSKAGHAGLMPALPDVIFTSVNLSPRVLQPVVRKASLPPQHLATAPLTPPLIVRDQPLRETMATITELKDAAIGTHFVAGPPAPDAGGGQQGSAAASGKGNQDSTEEAPAILQRAEFMPEFPGGLEALKRYLIKNLRMPETGLEPGTHVRVIAKFVVGQDGKVTGIETALSGGEVYDSEVKRVINRMPDWKPGIQNHKKVAVYFSLPVDFMVPEDN